MFRLNEIIRITGGNALALKADPAVKSISTDSRTIREGELFIALKGPNFNGADFIGEAKQKGAVGAVVGEDLLTALAFPLIRVKDTTKALADIAGMHRERFNRPVIAVTGSNGKTTTKDMIAHILSQRFKVLRTERTENNKIGVPLTLLKLKDHDIAVLEIGTSSPGEIRYSATVAKPTIAIITNIGPSHLEGLRDVRGVLNEKINLVRSLDQKGVWIRNADDPMLMSGDYKNTIILDYGIRNQQVDFKAENIKQLEDGIEFDIKRQGMCIDKFYLPMIGVHNVYNALAAICTCSPFMDIKLIREAISDFKGPSMRMEVLHIDGFTIINDSYNSNPFSLRYAISTLREYPCPGRRVLVLADMLELGSDAAKLHYESGKAVAEDGIDMLVTFGELASNIARGARDNGMDENRISVFKDKDSISSFLRSSVKEGDTLLIKGSRRMKMEEVCECFITCSTR